MTDKEKIREEVERLKSQLLRGACSSQIVMETMCKEEAYNEVLAILDTMQEEPVSIWHDASKKSDNPEDVVIINPSDNTGEVLTKCTGVNQGHIWAYTSELLKIEQKSAKWSEEDERIFQIVIDILDKEEHKGYLSHTDLVSCVRKLKSLKDRVLPQNTWKPSDEQMKALKHASNDCSIAFADMKILATLYEQLKTLHRYEQDT